MSVTAAGDLRLQRVLDAAGIGYWEWIPATGRLYVDERLAGWLGASPTTFKAFLALTQDHQQRTDGTTRYRIGKRWIEERRSVGTGSDRRTVAACIDVTRRHHDERTLAWDASHDELTGLLSRRSFDRVLREALARPHDSSAAVTVFMLDLDSFKPINDHLGHDAGDQVLTTVGHRLRSALRRDDPVARWGGDEFALIVDSDVRALRAGSVADRLLDTVRAPIQLSIGQCPVRASLGIAMRHRGEDQVSLTRRADRALYAAKTDGGDRWCVDGWAE